VVTVTIHWGKETKGDDSRQRLWTSYKWTHCYCAGAWVDVAPACTSCTCTLCAADVWDRRTPGGRTICIVRILFLRRRRNTSDTPSRHRCGKY